MTKNPRDFRQQSFVGTLGRGKSHRARHGGNQVRLARELGDAPYRINTDPAVHINPFADVRAAGSAL